MKAIVVTCYESNEERVSYVANSLKKRGFDVEVVTTDFSHIKKEKRDNVPKEYIAIETKPYTKNLSLARLISHKRFAKDAFKYVERQVPDFIWLMAPANSLIKEASKYKKKYPLVKLVIDIIDMWPESLPIRINKSIFPFNLWRNIRRNNIKCADELVTECDLYHEILKDEYNGKITTIRWSRDSKMKMIKPQLPEDKLSLCYIGSINNIIDTNKISSIIGTCDKPVELHVIGEGENSNNFVSKLEKVCKVIYYGPIRDENRKSEIFSMCHAGLNIYKDNLYIGLTVKSIDYFEHGLPIINNIKGDTWDLIEKNKAGINISDNVSIESKTLLSMRSDNKNIYDVFKDNFSLKSFEKKCLYVIDEVMQ